MPSLLCSVDVSQQHVAHREETTNEPVQDVPTDKQDTMNSMISSGALGLEWSASVPTHYLRKHSEVWQQRDLLLMAGLLFLLCNFRF